MAIPESQLNTWSHQGSITQSASTYNTIKSALEASTTAYAKKSFKVYLQGSYGNDTNIFAESDVDVVIQLDDVYYSDLTALSPEDKIAFDDAFIPASYSYDEYKQDVFNALKSKFGNDVILGDKAILVEANGNRRKADVIAAMQFRRYFSFKNNINQSYEEGICFFNSNGDRIVNYPKQHSTNLTKKHKSSNQWLKPMVRIIKNLRTKLIEDGLLGEGVAPSYYIEGLMYNVPDAKFGKSYEDCFINAMTWIQKEADKSSLVCANEQYYLLRDNEHTCWKKDDAETFLNAAIGAWNNW